MNFFGFLAPVLGIVMEWIYKLIPNYGWTIIIFTLLMKILLFPLGIKQQKSTAKMSVYQPMMMEIQKKWANDKQRQQEELIKFQQETGMSMTGGCLPMLLNMLVLFGLIEVVYRPMRYLLRIPVEAIEAAAGIAGLDPRFFTVQNQLINSVKASPSLFTEVLDEAQIAAVTGFNFNFFGIDLSQIPRFAFDAESLVLMIIPVLSVVTMILSQIVMTKMSGQQMQGAMKWMPWVMSAMFVYFGFTVPVGFSLYYTVSNVLMLVQSVILNKMYNPAKLKEELEAQVAEKMAARKQKKEVKVIDEKGKEVVKEMSLSEMQKMRLARARELDKEKYGDD